MKSLLLGVLLLLAGCSHQQPLSNQSQTTDPLLQYTQPLADQLFSQFQADALWQAPVKIAVASFVPVNTLSLEQAADAEKQQANQLSEAMLTLARQSGFTVYDYRLRSAVMLKSDHEQALSRQVTELADTSDADAILTGTYSMTGQGMVLNVRVIRITDRQVLAAANGFVPDDALWPTQQIIKRGDKLYRQSSAGVM